MSEIKLNYHKTHFLTSAPNIRAIPEDTGIEIAFAGRSNAGKSTALNALTNQKSLARTSKTPGRTQLINLFEVEPNCKLVDLPGYGYYTMTAQKPVAFSVLASTGETINVGSTIRVLRKFHDSLIISSANRKIVLGNEVADRIQV